MCAPGQVATVCFETSKTTQACSRLTYALNQGHMGKTACILMSNCLLTDTEESSSIAQTNGLIMLLALGQTTRG